MTYEQSLREWGAAADAEVSGLKTDVATLTAEAARLEIQCAVVMAQLVVAQADLAKSQADLASVRAALAECQGANVTPIRDWAAGTWVLDQVGSAEEVTRTAATVKVGLGLKGVAGYSVRALWSALEPSRGVYDFSIFDRARQLHPNAKIMIRFIAGRHTPEWWQGGAHGAPTWKDTQSNGRTYQSSGPYPTPFKPDGSPNTRFEEGYRKLVRAMVAWCIEDQAKTAAAGTPEAGCRILHLSAYGRLWAEIANNSAATNLGGAPGTPVTEPYRKGGIDPAYPNAVVGMAGYSEARMIDAHWRLIHDIAAEEVAGTNIAIEHPMSGYGTAKIAPELRTRARNTWGATDPYFFGTQQNSWGYSSSISRGDAAANALMFGSQSYAVHGPSYGVGQNGISWVDYFRKNTEHGVLYTEVYLESFTGQDLVEITGPIQSWVPTPTPPA